jgi:thioredoxin reductase (NADPH)
VTLIHRRNEFRVLRFCRKVGIENSGKIKMITPGEVVGLNGATRTVVIEENGAPSN